MPAHRPEEGKTMTYSCECGADKFEVVCGPSRGWGEIREVKRTVTDPKTGVDEEIEGLLIWQPKGDVYWLVYPVDPHKVFEEHDHDGYEGEDGG